MTQKELAELSGIGQPNINRFEKKIHSATLTTTIKILDALGYKITVEKNKETCNTKE